MKGSVLRFHGNRCSKFILLPIPACNMAEAWTRTQSPFIGIEVSTEVSVKINSHMSKVFFYSELIGDRLNISTSSLYEQQIFGMNSCLLWLPIR